jgi:hypothetical protein
MKSKQFSTEQIVTVLKQPKMNPLLRTLSGIWGYLSRPFTAGKSNMADFNQKRSGSSSNCSRRIAA